MEFLPFHYQLVSHLAPENQNNDRVVFNIVEGAKVARTQFEFCKRIGAQAFDRLRNDRGLMLKPGQDCCFEDSLFARQ